MRIALVAPLVSIIAQPYLGGSQAVLADLAYGLQQRGHQVTVFARAGSRLTGVHTEYIEVPEQVRPADFADQSGAAAPDAAFFVQAHLFLALFLQLQQRSSEFDVVHVHAFDWPAYTFSSLLKAIPVLHTLHLPALNSSINQALQTLHQAGHALTLSTVSQSCARSYAEFTPIDYVIYNGLDLAAIPFQAAVSADAPLLYVGRIAPEKGVEAAIDIAEKAGGELVLVGSIYDQEYYEQRIVPRVAGSGGSVSYLGQMERERVWELMGKAQALLCPIAWEEAFGLTTAEALAAGTPVIAFRRGAMEEIVRQGETGFLVEPGDCEQAAACVQQLAAISRAACRASIEKKFPIAGMLTAYERVYSDLHSALSRFD